MPINVRPKIIAGIMSPNRKWSPIRPSDIIKSNIPRYKIYIMKKKP
jgi:hypothetical protein